MKKTINTIAICISALLVLFAIYVDLNPMMAMGGKGKIILYGVPMILLFADMVYQIKTSKEVEEKEKIKKKMLTAIFVIYLIAIGTLLFLGNTYRFMGGWYSNISIFSKEYIENSVNLIPFRTIGTYFGRLMEHSINTDIVVTNILGNIIAFAPFGFFIPMLFDKKIKNVRVFTLLMAGIIFLVELLQFIAKVGQADIDDLILNLLGAVIAYIFMKSKLGEKLKNTLFS